MPYLPPCIFPLLQLSCYNHVCAARDLRELYVVTVVGAGYFLSRTLGSDILGVY